MIHLKKTAIITSALLIILIEICSAADKTSAEQFSFLPQARLSIAPSVINGNNDSSALLTRYLAADAFRYGALTCSFNTYEIMGYSDEKSGSGFSRIYYDMEYINLRLDSGYGIASAFIDHRCINYVSIPAAEEMLIRWYGYGFRWESPGMMIGEKDKRHGSTLFSSGDYINYSASVHKPISTTYYPYDYIMDISLRYDYYLAAEIIPYISGSAELLLSDRLTWNRSAEAGVRFDYGYTDLIPFVQYSYAAEYRIANEKYSSFTGAGVRIESVLFNENETNPAAAVPGGGVSLSPELHMRGSYSKYIGDDERNFRSDILFSIYLLQFKYAKLLCNTSLVHSSPELAENTGLYPAYLDYYYEAGISFNTISSLLIEPVYRYTGYGEGNTGTGASYDYHLSALRICTAGFKPGYINSSIIENNDRSFLWINNIEWEILSGCIPVSDPDNPGWLINTAARWDIFTYNSTVPYIMLRGEIMRIEPVKFSTGIDWIITSEYGIRRGRYPALILFYRNQIRKEEIPALSISRVYHLFGIGLDF